MQDYDELLGRFDAEIAKLARKVVATISEVHPELEAKVRLGWGSVNFRHPKAGFVCAVFPQAREGNVILVFEHGRLLSSPLLVDNGKVTQVRWIPFRPGDEIPVDDIAILIAEAVALRA
jgi:hypothetical protein